MRGLCLLVLLAGCPPAEPVGHDPSDPHVDGFDPPTFTCDPAAAPVASPLRRLSQPAYVNTVRALAGAFDHDDLRDALLAAVTEPLAAVPADTGEQPRLDQLVGDDHVTAYYHVGDAFGRALVAEDWRVQAALGDCAVDWDSSNDRACVEAFIRDFGARVTRRPVPDAEVAFLMDEVFQADDLDRDSLAALVTVLLSSPHMLYHLEDGAAPVDGRDDLAELSAFELANRLAYHFWQAPPDDALLAAAADGSLLDDAVYAAQLDRVSRDPRTAAATEALFTAWLHTDALRPFDGLANDPRYAAFAGEDAPAPGLRERMLADAADLVHYEVARDGTLDDLFRTAAIVTRDPDVAALYDSYPWDGASEPDHDPARYGILTRPALVAAGSHLTQPIHKGVRIRRHILCDTVGAPPADLGDLPTIDERSTRRSQTEQLTEREGTSCLNCHQRTNPLGYATEDFDALGRFRTEETIYAEDGAVLDRLPVDTSAVPRLDAYDVEPVAGAEGLSERIIASGKHHACFARFAVRHVTARLEDEVADGCWLESIREDLADGRPLVEALRDVAARPEFRLKAL